jgi:hypothetical protein
MKNFKTVIVLLGVAFLLSACNAGAAGGYSLVRIENGTAAMVEVHDPLGIPGQFLQLAEGHCQKYGKSAQYHMKKPSSYNIIYHCV